MSIGCSSWMLMLEEQSGAERRQKEAAADATPPLAARPGASATPVESIHDG